MSNVVQLNAAPDPEFVAAMRKMERMFTELLASGLVPAARIPRLQSKLDRIRLRNDQWEAQACRLSSR